MKFTEQGVEVSAARTIPWGEVQELYLLNRRLVLILSDDKREEFPNLSHFSVDAAFKAYEDFIRKKHLA